MFLFFKLCIGRFDHSFLEILHEYFKNLIGLVASVFDVFDNGIESAVFVSRVGYYPLGAIGFYKGVLSLDLVSVPGFPLTLDVVGMEIVNGVVVMVVWGRLKRKHKYMIV